MAGSLIVFCTFVYQISLLRAYACMLLSLFGFKYLLGLSLCAAVLLFLCDSSVWAVPNWHLRLLAFRQELHSLDACFHICYCD